MILQTTLSLAAAAAVINFWLAMRIGRLRGQYKVSFGTGGQEPIERRMRAQLNFVEQVPLLLILIAAIEASGKGGAWLAPVGAVIMACRVFHALGMDSDKVPWGRAVGTATSMFGALGLATVAVLIALGLI